MTTMATPKGTVQFISNHAPALEAGDYTLTAQLDVTAVQAVDGQTGKASDTSTTRFAVWGERFSFAPSQILTVFPPANSSGAFDTVLPHVILSRRTLPWERTPRTDDQKATFKNGNVGSWLALLVFTNTEMMSMTSATPAAGPQTGTVQSLMPGASGGLPAGMVSSIPDGILDPWERSTDPCNFLDVPRALFSAVAPSYNDLGWLAHARRKTIPTSTAGGSDDVTDYAVVIGNRFPPAGEVSHVFLVSLERMGDYLPDDQGNPSPQNGQNSVSAMRLVVFTSWQITSASDAYRFKELLDGLDGCQPGQDATFRLGATGGGGEGVDAIATAALNAGYTALAHATRAGDNTISWYRGPFSPAPVPPVLQTGTLPADCADDACAYDPSTGMFDVSYASAWTLGRLLGLADKRFASGIYAFKQGLRQNMSTQLKGVTFERSILIEAVKGALI